MPLRVCMISQTLNPNRGYGRFASNLIQNLKHNQYDIVILVERNEPIMSTEKAVLIRNRRLGVFINPLIISFYARSCFVIHALDGYPFGIYVAIASFILRKKNIITLQGTYAIEPLYHRIKGHILLWAYNRADRLVAISNFTKQEVLKKINNLSVAVIHHGVDCYELLHGTEGAPLIAGDYVLSVGMITYRKGYHVSLPAFAAIKDEFPNLKYVIVGKRYSYEYWLLLQETINKHHMKDRIIFFDLCSPDELANLYRNAKVFLLHSCADGHHVEGFGLVFLEAGCFSVPVIGAFGSGAEDAIQNGKTGFLVPEGSMEKTAEAMRNLLTNESLRCQMGDTNAQFAQDNPWSVPAKQYSDLYASL